MNTLGVLLIGMAMGIGFIYLANYVVSKIHVRLNYGQIVRFDNERVGNIVVCRYNGMKKYFYTDDTGTLNPKSFYERADAIHACHQAHLDNMVKREMNSPRHHQSRIARV